jgi:hypothetical protein
MEPGSRRSSGSRGDLGVRRSERGQSSIIDHEQIGFGHVDGATRLPERSGAHSRRVLSSRCAQTRMTSLSLNP